MASTAKIKGLTIELSGDTSGLQKSLKEVNSTVKTTQTELKGVNTLLKMDPTNVDLIKQKQKLLATQIGQTEDKLKGLKQAQEDYTDGKLDLTEEEYRDLQREIASTEGKLESLKKEQNSFANEGSEKLYATGEKFQQIGGKAEDAGKKMMGLTTAIGAIYGASIVAFNEVDEGMDTVIKKTGATGASAEEMQGIYEELASTMAVSFEDVGNAVGEIGTRFQFTGDTLKDASAEFLKFARVNNTDVTTSIQLVSRAMGDAGIDSKEYSTVLDSLTTASQKSGVSIDKLTENITKYGAPMRAMGYTTQESIAMFSTWEKQGVNTEIAMSGLKKAIANFSAEGKDAKVEVQKTIEEIKNMDDISQATGKAIEVFGTKAGPDLADAIKGGRFEFQDMVKALDNSKGSLDKTYDGILDGADEAKIATNNAKLALSKLGETLLQVLTPAIKGASNFLKGLANWFSNLSSAGKTLVTVIGLIVAGIGPLLIAIGKISTGVGAVLKLVSSFGGISVAGLLNPWTIGIGAVVGALSLATIALVSNGDEMSKNVQKGRELAESLNGVQQASDESAQATVNQYGAYTGMVDELQNYIDANGQVKAGCEDRVNYILNELNSALGTEYSLNGNLVQKNGEVVTSYKEIQQGIMGVINAKQAEALLADREEAYNEAVKNRTELVKAEQSAHQRYTTALTEDTNKIADLERNRTDKNSDETDRRIELLQAEMDSRKMTWDQSKKDLDDANLTINDYQNAQRLLASGTAEDVAKANAILTGSYVDGTKTIKYTLDEQIGNAQATSESLIRIANESGDEYDKAMAEQAVANERSLNQQLAGQNNTIIKWKNPLTNSYEYLASASDTSAITAKYGADAVQKYGAEVLAYLNKNGGSLENAFDHVAGKASDTSTTTGKNGNKSGESYTEEQKKAVNAKIGTQKLFFDNAVATMTNTSSIAGKNGDNTGKSYNGGISSWTGSVAQASQTLGLNAIGSLDKSGDAKTKGSNTGAGYSNGIGSTGISVTGSASGLANSALGALGVFGKWSGGNYTAGQNFSEGLNNGTNDNAWMVKSACSTLALMALTTLRKGLGVRSPSKKTAEIGKFLDLGMAEGIDDNTDVVSSSIDNLNDEILNSFNSNVGTLEGSLKGGTFDVQTPELNAIQNITKDFADINLKANTEVVKKLDDLQKAISTMGLYLDKDKLIGGTIKDIDTGLGQIATMKERR